MNLESKSDLIVQPLQEYPAELGRWAWLLQDARQRTLDTVQQIDPESLDWVPPYKGNTIATLLYHIAAIEADYLYGDILGKGEFPEAIDSLLPVDVRDEQGQLSIMLGVTLDEHLQRLEVIREDLLKNLKNMSAEEFHQPRENPDNRTSPEWILHHLLQHEAEHRGQIKEIYLNYQRQE